MTVVLLCVGVFLFIPLLGGVRGGFSFAQSTAVIDSLKKVLKTTKEDTTRIKTLNELAWELKYNNPDTAILLSTQALELSEELMRGFSKRRISLPLGRAKVGLSQSHNNLGVFNYFKGNYPIALNHYNKALKINNQLNDKKGIAASLSNIGIVYWSQGDYPKALKYYFKALKMDEELGNKKGIADRLGNIAGVYLAQGDYPKALEYFFKALKMKEELGAKSEIVITLGNIGVVYWNQSDYPKALEYYFKALKISEELDIKSHIAAHLGNIGIIYDDQGDYPKALEYYFKALKVSEELGNKSHIATHLGNIGIVYRGQGEAHPNPSQREELFNKALEYYFKALKLAEEIGDKNQIALWLGNIGSLYTKQKKYPKAESYLLQVLEVSTEIGALVLQKYHHQHLSALYEQTGKPIKALEHYKEYSIAKDSIYNEEKSKEIGKLEAGFEYDKKLALEQAEHSKQAAVAASESKRQKVVIYAVSGGMGLMLILAFLIFRGYRQKKKANVLLTAQKQVIETKNKDITASIRYAQRIQRAILPPAEVIKKIFLEHFILYKPRDIVSGDFYFFAEVGKYKIVAAADCTGHGVPGAFMSMIGNDMLNTILNDKKITTSSMVLDELNKGIQHAVNIGIGEEDIKDGMDIAVITISPPYNPARAGSANAQYNLQYAGAYNPLYIVRSTNKSPLKGGSPDLLGQRGVPAHNYELTEIKADKQPIGYGMGKDQPFTNHEIQLQKGDTIYIFSDGYQDQFGGEKNKKFMAKRFRELLLSIQDKSTEEQKEMLNKTIEEWMGNREQIDDILVIGIKV
ncbi:tetratricopeptide repeat protein [bacterium AH-315-M05]|nr:tetratricopeptide repeat protein [bacterium AH-315-M05]